MGRKRFAFICLAIAVGAFASAQKGGPGFIGSDLKVRHPLNAPLPSWHPEAQVGPEWNLARPIDDQHGPQNNWVTRSEEIEYDVESGRPSWNLMSMFAKGPAQSEDYQGFAKAVDGSLGDISKLVVIGADGRVKITNSQVFPWRTMCKLRMKWGTDSFIGSGILIGNKYVLTAAHCVYDPSEGGWASSVEVIPGLKGATAPYGKAKAVKYRSFTGWTNGQSANWDMALITLNTPIGNTVGWFGYASYATATLQNMAVAIAGYPGDKDDTNWLYRMAGNIQTVYSDQYHYQIDTAGGQSGSGIYRYVNSHYYVVGTHCYGQPSVPKYNGGTRMTTAKFNSVKGWIATGT
jgi:V8-like Glu-specific endopeptidase